MAKKINTLITICVIALWLMGFFKWYIMLGIILLAHMFITDDLLTSDDQHTCYNQNSDSKNRYNKQ